MKRKEIITVQTSRYRELLPPDSIAQGNAYGSVLIREQVHERFDLWTTMPIICGHGGSMWLCKSCAESILCQREPKKQLKP